MKNSDLILEQLTSLEARVATLEGMPAPKAVPKSVLEDEGVKITYPQPTTRFVMPSEAELRQLLNIVGTRFQNLRPRFSGLRTEEDEIKYFRQFRASFRALGFMNRADALDHKHAASYWADSAEDLLRAQGASETVSLGPFTVALISHGDIIFSALDRWPHDIEFGLCVGGVGRLATDAWRRVLATGKPPEPVPVAMARMAVPQPNVRIVG